MAQKSKQQLQSSAKSTRNVYLYVPKHSNIHMGVVYSVLMLIVGVFAVLGPSPLCGWISLSFFILSCLNQPLPLGWRYTISNVMFPIMLIALAYNINPDNNPAWYFLGGSGKGE